MALSESAVEASNDHGTKRRLEEGSNEIEQPLKKYILAQPETDEDLTALVAKAMERAGAPPDEAQTRGSYVTKLIDIMAQIMAENKVDVQFATLGFNLSISQHDDAWIKKRDHFVEALKHPTDTPIAIFDRHFTKTQQLYLMPPNEDALILAIQKDHTKVYKEALGSTGRFRGVPDNLATKLTMLSFGLPIEPLTLGDLSGSSEEGDKPSKPDPPLEAPRVQRIMYAEKPLEFLDKYGECRSHGYPMLRRVKRRDLAPPIPRPSPVARFLPAANAAPTAQPPTENGGGEALSPTISCAITTPAGNEPGYTTAPTPKPRKGSHNHHQPKHYARYINPGQFTVSMRGGGEEEDEEVEEEEEEGILPHDFQPFMEPTYQKFLYGYHGKLRITENNQDVFIKTALRLLEYDFTAKLKPKWNFLVDSYPDGPNSNGTLGQEVNESNIHLVFSLLAPLLDQSAYPNSAIFVRTSLSPKPEGQIEPCRQGMKDVVRLSMEDGSTSYWKIPKDILTAKTEPKYGINQCQPGFLRAIRLLFDPEIPRPLGSVYVDGIDLGFGGMEATVELWGQVCEKAKSLKDSGTKSVDLQVDIGAAHRFSDGEIGSHLTGSHHEAKASIVDPTLTYNEIKGMSEVWLKRNDDIPDAVVVWPSAEDREGACEFQFTISLKDEEKENSINSLAAYLQKWKGRTNCIWWQPKFKSFSVQAFGDDGLPQEQEVQWEGANYGQRLSGFRNELSKFSADLVDVESFILVDSQSESHGRKLVVTKDTTEKEWQLHIYQWIHSPKFFIRKPEGVDYSYVVDKGSAFGISPAIGAASESLTTAPNPSPTGTGNEARLGTGGAGTGGTRPGRTGTGTEAVASGSALAPRAPTRMNRERIVAAIAGKPKAQKWEDWMTEQHFQDSLQRKSWIKDQSVVEPGRMPAPPLFGPSRELQLTVGSSMPTIYAQRLTPTDIKQLQDENQKLRNQVLDRMFACPICSEEFETYDKDKIRDHVKQHQTQLQEAGHCPSCGDPQWAFMTSDEKRTHFAIHQYSNDGAKIKHFYQDQHCPVCGNDLSKLKPEEVIHHCLEHAPGQVRYCNRCGLDEKDCNREELVHHHHKCLLAADRLAGDPEPVFCKSCGADRINETPEDRKKHQTHCREGLVERFCTKCGFNMAAHHWNRAEIDKHDQHCMPPSGFKRKFCEKCRTELSSLDDVGVSHHEQTCRRVEPAVPSEQTRLIELKQRQDIATQMDASPNARKAYIKSRDRDQTACEETLNLGEKSLRNQQATYDALKSQVDKQQAQNRDYDSDVPGCPYPECTTVIAKMNRPELVRHLKKHASTNETIFVCPLERADGSLCTRHMSLKEGSFDLTIHYKHKLSDDEQAAVNSTASSMYNEFKKLRAKIQLAQPQLTSNVDFLRDRSETLTQVAVASFPAHHHALPPKLPASSKTVNDDPELLPKIDGESPDHALTRSSVTKARGKSGATRRRRPSISLQEYRDLGVDDTTSISSDELEETVPVSIKKTARSSKTAPAKPAPVASKKRKQTNIEEDVISTKKAPQKALPQPPVKKKQMKIGDTAVAAPLPMEASRNVTAGPAKEVERPKAKEREEEDEGVVTTGVMRRPLKRFTTTPAKK